MKHSSHIVAIAVLAAVQLSFPQAVFAADAGSSVNELYAKAKAAKKNSDAIKLLTQALVKNPKSKKCLKARGSLYHAYGEYLHAAIDLQNYLKLSPNDYRPLVMLGICYRNLNKRNLALKTYKKAINLKPKESWAYATTANIYQDLKQYDRSIYYTNKALKLKPNNVVLYCNRAGVYRLMGKYDLAIKDSKKAIQLAPKNPRVYGALAGTYYDLGYYQKAVDVFKKMASSSPNNINYWTNYATALMKVKDYRESIKACNRALYLNKRSPTAYRIRGAVYSALGNDKQGLKDLNKSLEMDPKSSATYAHRASLLMKLGHLEQATQDYESARKCSVTDSARRKKGEAPSMSSLRQILSLYTRTIESNSGDLEAYYNRGVIHFSMGNYEAALKDFKVYSGSSKASKKTLFYCFVYMVLLDRIKGKDPASEIAKLKKVQSVGKHSLIEYLEGKNSSKQLLESTGKKLNETLARFVVAVNQYSKKNKKEAASNLQWIRKNGDESRDEYMVALSLLERISGK